MLQVLFVYFLVLTLTKRLMRAVHSTGLSKRRPIAAAPCTVLSVLDVNHPIRGRAIRSSPQFSCPKFQTPGFCHRLQLMEKK